MRCSSGRKRAEPIRRSHATVHEKIAAGDKSAFGPHQQCRNIAHLVRGAAASDGTQLDHASITRAAWTIQLVACKRRKDDAGAYGVDPGAALAPPYRLRHD